MIRIFEIGDSVSCNSGIGEVVARSSFDGNLVYSIRSFETGEVFNTAEALTESDHALKFEYKIGDVVRCIDANQPCFGKNGVIHKIEHQSSILVRFGDFEGNNKLGDWWIGYWQLKLVSAPQKPKQDEPTNDSVQSPNHYLKGGIETIDYIRAKLSKDAFHGYCVGNVMKYVSRYEFKNGVEDLRKARVYLDWVIEDMLDSHLDSRHED
jgi:hypothetical protein